MNDSLMLFALAWVVARIAMELMLRNSSRKRRSINDWVMLAVLMFGFLVLKIWMGV